MQTTYSVKLTVVHPLGQLNTPVFLDLQFQQIICFFWEEKVILVYLIVSERYKWQ